MGCTNNKMITQVSLGKNRLIKVGGGPRPRAYFHGEQRRTPFPKQGKQRQQRDSTQLADLGEESAHLGEAMILSRRQAGLERSSRRLISEDFLMALHLTSCAEHSPFHNQWKVRRINNSPRYLSLNYTKV